MNAQSLLKKGKDIFARLTIYFFTLLGVISFNFFLIRFLPGGPFESLLAPDEHTNLILEPMVREKLMAYYQLDQPLFHQYLHYLFQTLKGDLGFGIYFQKPVSQLIKEKIPWSLFIIMVSGVIAFIVGLFFSALSALKRHKKLDLILLVFFLFLSSVPLFLVAMIFLVCFSVKLNWFPLAGAIDVMTELNSILWIKQVILHSLGPILVLAFVEAPSLYLVARSAMFNALDQPWMEFGFLRGLKLRRIIIAYLIPAGLAPVITRLGTHLAFLLAGTIFVEMTFSYPGLGRLLFQAVQLRDYPVMQGVFLVMTLVVLLMNFVVDISYQWLDPRIGKRE